MRRSGTRVRSAAHRSMGSGRGLSCSSSSSSFASLSRRRSIRVPLSTGPLRCCSLTDDPLTNIWRAAFEGGAGRFPPRQEPDRVLIDEFDFLEVQNESTRLVALD